MSSRPPLVTPRFVALWLYAFVTFFSAFQLLPAIPFRILALGGSKAAAGWFLTVYTYASAFAAPLMGAIADAVGRRRMLIASSIVFVIFSAAYGVIPQISLLLVVGIIHGALWSSILASSSAMISDFIPEERRTEGIAYWGLSSTAAIAIAPAVGLWVYNHFQWRWLCGELAVLSIVMAVSAWRLPVKSSAHPLVAPKVSEVWDWRVIHVSLSLSAYSFGYGGVTSYAAIVAKERHISPPAIYLTTFAVTVVVIRLTTSHLADRIGPMRVLYPALALMPIAYALLAVAQTRWLFVTSAILFGTGLATAYPSFITFILGATDPARRARTFGSIVWAFDTGIGTGSLVIGAIGEHQGLRTAFFGAALLACLSIPILAWAARGLRGTHVASLGET